MRPLSQYILLLWSASTLALLTIVVRRAVGAGVLHRVGLTVAAVLGPLASLVLLVQGLEASVFRGMPEARPDRAWDPWGVAFPYLLAGLPVAAVLGLFGAAQVSPGGRSRRWPRALEGLALVGPVATLVLAWIVFGRGFHPTVQLVGDDRMWAWSLWTDAWSVLLDGLPLSAGVTGVLGVVQWIAVDRRAPFRVAGVYGWSLGLHAFAWFATLSNFPSV